ncbi:MAG: hypothetical protein DSZ23_00720 [Thermodesulfatator sp.]|nr:MAG: hypothetical protein DSZ23_00720 [Thermodesulfatator sp.]
MTDIICILVLGYLSAVFQSGAGFFLQVGYVRPDAIPALICWFSLRQELPQGIAGILLLSFIVSAFSIIPFYVFPLSYLIGYLTVRYIVSNVLEITNWQVYLLVGFVSIEIIVIQLAGSGNAELVWPWGLIQALLNMATAPLFVFFFDGFFKILKKISRQQGKISDG